ncbi:CRISPR-associated helicase Cas3' [Nocardia panacis]|uniref:CRISPR-associated helicase Cas3 n=1 Tax=Nocardia panacis TaxID=2340916 RepID=A0A3A4KSQ3_9NOCA|nr:CRISPR-associated helicase Cas3' [Nocardia panacis]RJO79155.1 CRISPR-associated helicase Cas3' [Nocardia panacis]
MNELRRLRAKSPRRTAPHGEALVDHLAATLVGAERLKQRVGRIAVVPDRFWVWVLIAALLHDAGKVPDGFQQMVAAVNGPVWKQRHEVFSLGFVADLLSKWPLDEQLWVAVGVLTHHRPLIGPAGWAIFSTYDESDPVEFTKRFGTVNPDATTLLRNWLARVLTGTDLLDAVPDSGDDLGAAAHTLLEAIRDQWEYDGPGPDSCLTAVLLQGAVTFADHISSAHATLLTEQPLNSVFALGLVTGMEASGKPLRRHQIEAAAAGKHLLVRMPTGSGKTEAALLWAAAQVEHVKAATGGQPRVFYLLPYLASINAMTDRLADLLGDSDFVGVLHSEAASYHLARSMCADTDLDETSAAEQAVSRAAASRLFRELVRVGTPYQLLRSAFAGPAHSSTLIDSANSVFILDELHAYEPLRLGMILAMIELWTTLGGRVGVVSATLPSRLETLLIDTLGESDVTVVAAADQPWPRRHRLGLRERHLTSPQAVDEIERRLHAGESVLVVANTVNDARDLYSRLAPIARKLHGEQAALLLHSRFKTGDRSEIEERIQQRYGTGKPHQPGILVATQVVEVSLDVSFDALHTSGAPLDALIQRFGRINRIAVNPPADVVVHAPDYRKRPTSDDEWADSVYDRTLTELTMSILGAHQNEVLDEQQLQRRLDELYESVWGDTWQSSVEFGRKQFREQFLTFVSPFDNTRAQLGDETFDELFNGIDAILEHDIDEYREALAATEDKSAGRLLGSQFLIPLPYAGRFQSIYDKSLMVNVIDAEYDSLTGLGAIRTKPSIRPHPSLTETSFDH